MKAYKLKENHVGFLKDEIVYGPLGVVGGSVKGYFPAESLDVLPGTNCFFESYVISNPDIFESLGIVDDPRDKKDPAKITGPVTN